MNIKPHDIVQSYKGCVFPLALRTSAGDLVSASAFHIGGGCLVTARHCIEDATLETIGVQRPLGVRRVHKSNEADLAIVETDLVDPIYCEVGGHLDDWIGDEFVMSKAVLMGYPPIPRARHAVLVAVEVEVNAVIDRYDGPHAHFIISAVPRGGFSGGPVFSEWGFLLGVMTASLYSNGFPSELGFAAAIGIEPLLQLIHDHQIPCERNLDFTNKLFDGEIPNPGGGTL